MKTLTEGKTNARAAQPGEPGVPTSPTSVIGSEREAPPGAKTDRHYSWLEDYLMRLEGKEARQEYYARLEG